MGRKIGVASFARAMGRAAPTRRPPTVLNAVAGAVNEILLVVNMLMVMLAVIWPRPEARETALFGAMVATGCGLCCPLLLQTCPAAQHPGVPSLS